MLAGVDVVEDASSEPQETRPIDIELSRVINISFLIILSSYCQSLKNNFQVLRILLNK